MADTNVDQYLQWAAPLSYRGARAMVLISRAVLYYEYSTVRAVANKGLRPAWQRT